MSTALAADIAALEKTNKILKAKVIELYNGGSTSTIHRQLENARKREDEIRRKRDLVQMRNQELEKHNSVLEAEVQERVEEVRTILNHVTFGFLTVGRDLLIGAEFTRSCVDLFGGAIAAGMNFLDLFELAPRERMHYQLGIDQIFEDILPVETSIGQLPKQFKVKNKTLKAEIRAVRSQGIIMRLLISVSDVTDLLAAQREAHNNRVLISLLKQKESFAVFYEETQESLAQLEQMPFHQMHGRRVLHTIKGNASSYGLLDIAGLIHAIEDGTTIDGSDIRRVRQALRSFLIDNQSILGIDPDQPASESFSISAPQMHTLRELIQDVPGERGGLLRTWTSEILQKPANLLVGPIQEFGEKLALRLNKHINFDIQGLQTMVDVDLMRGVLQNMVHLIRNAIDHGIEPDGLRADKPGQAMVRMVLTKMPHAYRLEVSDDGRGIDGEKLLARAIAKGIITPEQTRSLTRREQWDLIFIDGLSSADETTDISGRGVGMSAVLAEVKRVRGTIDISSESGQGTTFTIVIPIDESLPMPLALPA